jgi:hypothetical protein
MSHLLAPWRVSGALTLCQPQRAQQLAEYVQSLSNNIDQPLDGRVAGLVHLYDVDAIDIYQTYTVDDVQRAAGSASSSMNVEFDVGQAESEHPSDETLRGSDPIATQWPKTRGDPSRKQGRKNRSKAGEDGQPKRKAGAKENAR